MTENQFIEVNRDERKTLSDPAVEMTTPIGAHRPSHLNLLEQVPRYRADAGEAPLSAVVVPTNRPLPQARAGLELAARCAESRNAHLVVIRSAAACRYRFPPELSATTAGPTWVIDLPDSPFALLPDLENDHHRAVIRYGVSDLGLKRNLALLIGLCCGWSTVMFLDDDISLRPASQIPRPSLVPSLESSLRLHDALADFARYPDLMVAGYLQKDFDDQSVICRLRKDGGLEQAGFISGGAMIVRCTTETPLFPAIYNEDWLFMFAVMLRDQHRQPSSGVKRIGPVHQADYYPYRPPRARREEFGDTLAEGLYLLLEHPAAEILREARSLEHWRGVVHERKVMETDLLRSHLGRHGAIDHPVVNDMEACLRAALAVHPTRLAAEAAQMVTYVEAFIADLRTWSACTERIVARTGGHLALPEALFTLHLSEHVTAVSPLGSLTRPRTAYAS